MIQLNDKGPVILTALAGSGAVVSWLETFNQLVQIGAGLVAIVSGIAAAVYYIKRIVQDGKLRSK